MSPSNGVNRQKTPLVISIDAMGGDKGPAVVIDGIVKSLQKYSSTHFIVHGDKYKLNKLLGDEYYSSAKLEKLGFETQKSLKDMNETDF